MKFLRFFTSVPWAIHPSTNIVDHVDNSYVLLSFSFLPFFYFSSFWNLEIFFICSFRSFLCSFLLSILFILLFFSTLLSVPCFVLSLSVYSLYLLIPLIAFFSNLLFLFSFPMTLFCVFLLYVLLLFNLSTFCHLIFLEPSV